MTKQYEIPFMAEVKAWLKDEFKEDVKVVRANNCNESGVSDLILCYKGFYVAFELKTASELSPLQIEFIEEVRKAGGIAEEIDNIDWQNKIKNIFQKIENIICFYGM